MNLNLGELFYSEMVEVYSALAVGLLPIFLWILIPAMVLNRLIGNKEGWQLGALLGFVAYMTIGPYPSLGIF